MQKINIELEKILMERFGKDSLITLATVEDGIPNVRTVDSFYENGAFYILTYALSNKMKQIKNNSAVAISGEWFCKKENEQIANKMKTLFSEWINNGHNNFQDENTCILRIELTDGVLFSEGNRYDIDFTK